MQILNNMTQQNYEKEFHRYGLTSVEGDLVVIFLNELASIGIAVMNNRSNRVSYE